MDVFFCTDVLITLTKNCSNAFNYFIISQLMKFIYKNDLALCTKYLTL